MQLLEDRNEQGQCGSWGGRGTHGVLKILLECCSHIKSNGKQSMVLIVNYCAYFIYRTSEVRPSISTGLSYMSRTKSSIFRLASENARGHISHKNI